MTDAKKAKTAAKPKKVGKAPSLNERITDFSTGGYVGTPIWTPKKTGNKKK